MTLEPAPDDLALGPALNLAVIFTPDLGGLHGVSASDRDAFVFTLIYHSTSPLVIANPGIDEGIHDIRDQVEENN